MPRVQGKLLSSSTGEVKLSGDELTQLRKNVEEQEVLIKGYQQENEVATRKIKVECRTCCFEP